MTNHEPQEPVFAGGRHVGFVRRKAASYEYTAYGNITGNTAGPFQSKQDAESWVRRDAETLGNGVK
jgi:hypothetical protein